MKCHLREFTFDQTFEGKNGAIHRKSCRNLFKDKEQVIFEGKVCLKFFRINRKNKMWLKYKEHRDGRTAATEVRGSELTIP